MKERGKMKFYSYVYADLLGELKILASKEERSDRVDLMDSFVKKLAFYQFGLQVMKMIKDQVRLLVDETSELQRYIMVYEEIMFLIEGCLEMEFNE